MAVASPPGTFAKGYLLKHNRDHRTSNILGSKYKRRWVEVTANTMVYAPSQHDTLTGQIQVFAIADMLWVKPEADTKFQVKFSERSLKFKVAAGGKEERDLWVAALQAAKKQQEATDHARRSGVGKLELLQKALLQPDLSSSTAAETRPSEAGSMVLSSAGNSLDGSSAGAHVRSSAAAGSLSGLRLTASTFGAAADCTDSLPHQPPSPRTLLASARAGLALVNSMSPAGTPRALAAGHTPSTAAAAGAAGGATAASAQKHRPAGEGFFLFSGPEAFYSDDSGTESSGEASASEAEEDEGEDSGSAPVSSSTGGVSGGHEHRADAVPALQLPADISATPPAAGPGQATPSPNTHRATLARRVTPGVLLSASPSQPATPAAGAASQPHSMPLSPHTTRPSTATPATPLLAAAAAGGLLPCGDEVLILDDEPVSKPAHHTSKAGPTGDADDNLAATNVYSTTLYRSTMSSSNSAGSQNAGATPAAAIGLGGGSSSSGGASGDEVLRLDDDDDDDDDEQLCGALAPTLPSSSLHHHQGVSSQQQWQQQQQEGVLTEVGPKLVGGGSSRICSAPIGLPGELQVGPQLASGGSRPGSAAAIYRPGTALKSCLRNSPKAAPPAHQL